MSTRDRLTELAELIADGADIDWANEARGLDADGRRTLDRLARLDRLQRAMSEPEPEPEALPSFDRWGHLEILGPLGRGASSVVYRAFDPRLKRNVALKLRVARRGASTDAASWTEEARRLARVRHPNVLAVHGADVHHGVPGLWCDLLEGTTLEPGQAQPRPIAEVMDAADALLDATAAVHDAGLVHGDIKPSNLMREADGRIVLMDFGAASDLVDNRAGPDRAGTPLAMAPERFEGDRLTPAVDVFGIGVVLYALLEDRYPVLGAHASSIRARWQRGDRPQFRTGRGSRAFRRLVLRMMNPTPALRPSAREALSELRRLRASPVRRARAVAGLAVVALLAVALAVALAALRDARLAVEESEAVRAFLTDVLSAPRSTRLGPETPMHSMLEDSARLAPLQLGDQPAALADVLVTIAESLMRLDRLEPARNLLDQAADLQSTLDRPLDVARLRTAQADLARREQAPEAAEALYRQNLEQLQAGPVSTALRVSSWLGIGHIERQRGRYEAARSAYRAALDEAMETLGESSDGVAQARLSIGQLQLMLGRYEDALAPLQGAVDYYLSRSGPRNHNVLVGRTSLVEALDRLGRLDEARQLAERNADVAAEWLGPGDVLTVVALDALANIESRRGQPARALAISQEALDGVRQSETASAEMVLQFESNQVAYLLDLGRSQEALALAQRMGPEMLEVFEPGHPVIEVTTLNLADALLDVGRPIEALALARDLHRRYAAQLGDSHLFTLVAAYLTGGSLSVLDQADEAQAYLESARAGLADQLGASNSLTLKADRLLGEHWLRVGDVDRARAVVREAERRSVEALGRDHIRTRNLERLRASLEAPGTP